MGKGRQAGGQSRQESQQEKLNQKVMITIDTASILAQFEIKSPVKEVKPLGNGLINDTYRVITKGDDAPDYVLQRINNAIFQDVDLLQHNIEVVTAHIRRKLVACDTTDIDRKVLELVPAKDGKLYYKTPEGDYWRVYVLIENTTSQEKVTPESAYLTGEAFGRFQCQLSDLPFDELCESIPNFHNIEFRL